MTEQCDEIKTALDDGMAILTTKVRNYFVDFVLHGINNDLESCSYSSYIPRISGNRSNRSKRAREHMPLPENEVERL